MQSFIIKTQPTNEYDLFVTCYTKEHGKLTAIAKSALKQSSVQGMHLDVFNLVDMDLIEGRGTPIVTGAHAVRTYHMMRTRIPALAIGFFVLEALDKLLFERDADERLWEFLSKTLDTLDRAGGSGELLRDTQRVLLSLLGYAPSERMCAVCAVAESRGGWAIADGGGLLCAVCFLDGHKGVLLRDTDVSALVGAEVRPAYRTGRPDAPVGNSVFGALFEQYAQRPFASLPLLRAVLQ